MSKRRLLCHQVESVTERSERDGTYARLHEVHFGAVRGDHAPDGAFAFYFGKLYLPKRKRGVRFIVNYTQLHKWEL